MIDIKHLGDLDNSLYGCNSKDYAKAIRAESIIESAIRDILIKSGEIIDNPLVNGSRAMYATFPFEAVTALKPSVKANFECGSSYDISLRGTTLRTVPVNTHSLTYTSDKFGILIYINYLFPGTSIKGQLHYGDYTVDVDFTSIIISALNDTLVNVHEIGPLGNIENIL